MPSTPCDRRQYMEICGILHRKCTEIYDRIRKLGESLKDKLVTCQQGGVALYNGIAQFRRLLCVAAMSSLPQL